MTTFSVLLSVFRPDGVVENRSCPCSVRRNGLSLIEILISTMIMSIGILGVLASIPYGSYQLVKMNDADFSGNLGRNALRLIQMNQWHDPNQDCYPNAEDSFPFYMDSVSQKVMLNLTTPVFLDPLGRQGETVSVVNDFRRFALPYPFYSNLNNDLLGRFFRTNDDIVYGLPEKEQNSGFRPVIASENVDSRNLNSLMTTSFNGLYSWLAMFTYQATTQNQTEILLTDLKQVNVDVAVFKGRDATVSPYICEVVPLGTGYLGGRFGLSLQNLTGKERDTFLASLQQTKWLLLTGYTSDSSQMFAKWYKIANYKFSENDNNFDGMIGVYLTLVGETCPAWNGIPSICLFPNVCNVYSQKIELGKTDRSSIPNKAENQNQNN